MRLKLNAICVLSLISAVLAGCASNQSTARPYSPERQTVYVPNVGEMAEAEVGQTMISKSYLTLYDAIVLDKDWSEYRKQSMTNNRWSGTIVVPAGTLIKAGADDNGSFFKSENGYYEAAGTKSMKYEVGVFVPKDKNYYAVLYVYHKAIGDTGYEFGENKVAFKDKTVESARSGSFKKELIYNGVSKKSISLSYREFKDEMARPAFTQELKYDLNDGDVIGFKGARFQITKASNTIIKYKVIKPLD